MRLLVLSKGTSLMRGKSESQGGVVHPGLFRRDDQGRLGGVAQNGVSAIGAFHFGIVAQHADSQGQSEVLVGVAGPRACRRPETCPRRVSRAGHFDTAMVQRCRRKRSSRSWSASRSYRCR